MKIYTRTGDAGETGLFGGTRVSKASPRVSAYGDVDELNSVLGMVRAEIARAGVLTDLDPVLSGIQSRLFDLGAELANAKGKDLGIPLVSDEDVIAMERGIDAADAELVPLKVFVLPGGTACAAVLHLARTTARRAERSIVALAESEPVRPEVLRYVNRLSDLLFTWARLANRRAGVEDVPWQGRR